MVRKCSWFYPATDEHHDQLALHLVHHHPGGQGEHGLGGGSVKTSTNLLHYRYTIQSCCDSTGLYVSGHGMFGAVEEGKETAVRFFEEHVAEVKKVVPEDKLLVWEVRMSS